MVLYVLMVKDYMIIWIMFIKTIWIIKYYMLFMKKALFIFLDNRRRISRSQRFSEVGIVG